MKVLIADDDPISLRILEKNLETWRYEIHKARNGNEAWDLLKQDNSLRLAVLDWMMPGLDGVELSRKIREHSFEPYVYIIMLTSKNLKEDIISGLNAGADDYIVKPFNQYELEVRLRAGKRIIELNKDLIHARESLRITAMHDALTGLFNRGAIMDALRKEMARYEREGQCFALALFDLDYFKKVNDQFGHIAGDAVLIEISKRIRDSIRPYDVIGRYGGEEFMLLLPGCDMLAAIRQVERLRIKIAEQPAVCMQHRIPVTVSIGVTAYCGGEKRLEDIINLADQALYQAKRNGRNQIASSDLNELLFAEIEC